MAVPQANNHAHLSPNSAGTAGISLAQSTTASSSVLVGALPDSNLGRQIRKMVRIEQFIREAEVSKTPLSDAFIGLRVVAAVSESTGCTRALNSFLVRLSKVVSESVSAGASTDTVQSDYTAQIARVTLAIYHGFRVARKNRVDQIDVHGNEALSPVARGDAERVLKSLLVACEPGIHPKKSRYSLREVSLGAKLCSRQFDGKGDDLTNPENPVRKLLLRFLRDGAVILRQSADKCDLPSLGTYLFSLVTTFKSIPNPSDEMVSWRKGAHGLGTRLIASKFLYPNVEVAVDPDPLTVRENFSLVRIVGGLIKWMATNSLNGDYSTSAGLASVSSRKLARLIFITSENSVDRAVPETIVREACRRGVIEQVRCLTQLLEDAGKYRTDEFCAANRFASLILPLVDSCSSEIEVATSRRFRSGLSSREIQPLYTALLPLTVGGIYPGEFLVRISTLIGQCAPHIKQ